MRSIYEDTRVPLQLRRLMVFTEICQRAKAKPDEMVHLSAYTQLSLGVVYISAFNAFIAYGGVFEYAHTREEVEAQGIALIPNDEWVACALTTNLVAFTKPARYPVQLLWYWNAYVKNRLHEYVDSHETHFFKINDEIDLEYAPHRYHERLIATVHLPLWDDAVYSG